MIKNEYKIFGLVGKKIEYSFSRSYFEKKFKDLNLPYLYKNFDLNSIEEFKKILNQNQISGLNVTIPYKQSIIKYLDKIDPIAQKIGAVNTIKINDNKLIGFNTDYSGFKDSLENTFNSNTKALILGTGGASKAVAFALEMLNIKFKYVSRSTPQSSKYLNYNHLSKKVFQGYNLIINCTPIGTYPKINEFPPIPIKYINKDQLIYDLIYNPKESLLLKKAKDRGAKISNGYQMLLNQAEYSWEIWNK